MSYVCAYSSAQLDKSRVAKEFTTWRHFIMLCRNSSRFTKCIERDLRLFFRTFWIVLKRFKMTFKQGLSGGNTDNSCGRILPHAYTHSIPLPRDIFHHHSHFQTTPSISITTGFPYGQWEFRLPFPIQTFYIKRANLNSVGSHSLYCHP